MRSRTSVHYGALRTGTKEFSSWLGRFDFCHSGNPVDRMSCCSLGGCRMINLSAFTAGINRRAALCAATLGLYAAVVGAPVLAADAGNGKRVAVRCARPATSSLPTSVPFKEIADRPNFSEPGLVTFLLNPHA